ncbi:MAG: SCO family protein [Gammaproteobacteria bacterium]|jgi:protein SCO1/2|nr:SCO family protein [Gammaproteobacteria bacterium]
MNKLLGVVAALALVLGIWAYEAFDTGAQKPAASAFSAITVFPAGRALPAIDFIDDTGAVVGPEIFRGGWTILFMGFTNCGHLCPMTLAQVRMIADMAHEPVNVVFFSVDPGRDTPAVIRDYVKGFDESFVGLSAAPDEIRKLADALGAPYFVDPSPGNYVVDHASALFLISPQGEFTGTVSQPFDRQLIAAELDQLPRPSGG